GYNGDIDETKRKLYGRTIRFPTALPSFRAARTMDSSADRTHRSRRAGLPQPEDLPMKQVLRPTLVAAALIAALGVAGAGAAQAQTVDKNKASYVVGMDLANNVPQI